MTGNAYKFDLPQHHKSIIKVIGVGGGGSNAVNHMFNQGIKDVEFVICNTDSQALNSSPVPIKLQIGANLTSGLGAGANPEKGKNAALESKEDIRELLSEDTRMIFITAGMGGGTGTGAAPVIAKVARELDILTVGIVTAPFAFEGKKKTQQAEEGIRALKENCDTVLVILNDKLREIYGNQSISEAFSKADNVLTTAAKGIAEIITVPGYVNVDFEDVKTVMKNSGAAVMGSAVTSGDNRAIRAAEEAISSPLLNNTNILGAQKILLSIISGEQAELQMDELTAITEYMQEAAGDDAEVIFGHGVDPELGDCIRVTIIATGFDQESISKILEEKSEKKIHDLEKAKQIDLFEHQPKKPERPITEPVIKKLKDEIREEDEAEAEERSYVFDFKKKDTPPSTPKKKDDDDKGLFEFGEEYEVVEGSDLDPGDAFLEELEGSAHQMSKKIELMEQARERERKLANLKSPSALDSDSFKEKLEVPAYMRKKVKLQDVPHSSERKISKFNLNDDNQILGNNRFLHDNVD
ncbi:MAG: cell division protein FtsZ [Imperialibacter sp.]|uniref:cell division protein FtsZ n=1 Tax=Imperialibacter sp. TaxID=2038411 RepID=UPI003A8B2AEA